MKAPEEDIARLRPINSIYSWGRSGVLGASAIAGDGESSAVTANAIYDRFLFISASYIWKFGGIAA